MPVPIADAHCALCAPISNGIAPTSTGGSVPKSSHASTPVTPKQHRQGRWTAEGFPYLLVLTNGGGDRISYPQTLPTLGSQMSRFALSLLACVVATQFMAATSLAQQTGGSTESWGWNKYPSPTIALGLPIAATVGLVGGGVALVGLSHHEQDSLGVDVGATMVMLGAIVAPSAGNIYLHNYSQTVTLSLIRLLALYCIAMGHKAVTHGIEGQPIEDLLDFLVGVAGALVFGALVVGEPIATYFAAKDARNSLEKSQPTATSSSLIHSDSTHQIISVGWGF